MKPLKVESRYFISSIALLAVCLPTSAAWAQDQAKAPSEPDDQAGAGEIVVTAQKRQESVNKVGMSISAFSGDALVKAGIINTEQLVKVVPGFNYTKGAYGAPVYTVRGIGLNEQSLAAAPTVTVYVDEIPLPYSVMTEGTNLDIARVEVLKGPQGTLFGQNSTGGAINFIAAKPTDTLKAGFDLSVGRFSSVTASAFVSGPLSSTLRVRAAVRKEYADPWQVSASRPGDRLGKTDKVFGRLLADWTPTDRLSLLLSLSGFQNRSDAQAGQFVGVVNAGAPAALKAQPLTIGNPRIADWDQGGNFSINDDFWQAALRAEYEVSDAVMLTSISAYSDYKRDTFVDADGTPLQDFAARNYGGIQSFSQEIRLSGQSGPVRWVIGGNYQQDKIDDVFSPRALQSSFPSYDGARAVGRNEVDTYSGFANVDWEVADGLTLIGGLRYSWQDRSYQGCLYDSGAGVFAGVISARATQLSGQPTVIPPGGCVTLNSQTFQPAVVTDELNQGNLSWKAGVNWQVDPSKLLYASVSKGYKNGVFITTGATFDLSLAPATQESVVAYEAGFKLGLANRTIQLNGALFYYDYRDKQIRGRIIDSVVGPLNRIINIPKSRIAGAELQLIWQPTNELTLNLGATYIDSKILGNFVNFSPLLNQKLLSGEAFPLTPKWQLTSDVVYDFPVSERVNAFIGVNATYQGKTNAALGNEPMLFVKDYALVDLRLGLHDRDDAWRVTGFIQNVGDTYYWTNVSSPGPDAAFRLAGRPRTYGLSLSYRYQ